MSAFKTLITITPNMVSCYANNSTYYSVILNNTPMKVLYILTSYSAESHFDIRLALDTGLGFVCRYYDKPHARTQKVKYGLR